MVPFVETTASRLPSLKLQRSFAGHKEPGCDTVFFPQRLSVTVSTNRPGAIEAVFFEGCWLPFETTKGILSKTDTPNSKFNVCWCEGA